MEMLGILASIVAGFAIFGIAAGAWGVDSRDPLPDDHRR
jgi:hypothetical protein